jgi:hypothetical protein
MLCRRNLIQFFAGCDLSGLKKGFDEFAFAANGQAGKFLEPFAGRDFGIRAELIRQEPSWSAEIFRPLTQSSK